MCRILQIGEYSVLDVGFAHVELTLVAAVLHSIDECLPVGWHDTIVDHVDHCHEMTPYLTCEYGLDKKQNRRQRAADKAHNR